MRTFLERDIISGIRAQYEAQKSVGLVKGIGDDCAVFRKTGTDLFLITIDTLVEGVHFDLSWHPPNLLGRKAASVNISDISAMAGTPRFALLSLALPDPSATNWLDDFLSGFRSVLEEFGAILIGGDTVKSNKGAMFSICMTGEVGEDRILFRSGARPNDIIWVAGRLGEAGAGLALCQNGRAGKRDEWQGLISAQLDPKAQVRLGSLLGKSGLASAMIDLSDGLATDLAHLCKESGVAGEIDVDRIPMSAELIAAAQELQVSPLDWAIRGGEDYLLLFTAASEHGEALQLVAKEAKAEIFPVGRIFVGKGVFLLAGKDREEISYQGFDHFRG